MFKNLFDFAYQRNFKEAIGFYLAYLVLSVLLAFLAEIVSGLINSNVSGVLVGNVIAIVAALALSLAVLGKKKLLNSFGYLLLGIASGVLAYLGGGLLGLIIPAYFSTRPALIKGLTDSNLPINPPLNLPVEQPLNPPASPPQNSNLDSSLNNKTNDNPESLNGVGV